MALDNSKPIIRSIPTFDVNDGCVINFAYYGIENYDNAYIQFFNNSTGERIYSIDVSLLSATVIEIPSSMISGLSNGNIYYVKLQLFEQIQEDDTTITIYSNESDPTLCRCFSTPEFRFAVTPSVIHNSYFDAVLVYSQAQNVQLSTYNFKLYSSDTSDINTDTPDFSTGVLYATQNLTYLFQNLLNNKYYLIRAEGTTKYNQYCVAECEFQVNYDATPSYSNVKLSNVPELGAVAISCNIAVIEGHTSPTTPHFINNSELDLVSTDGSYVLFDDGFNIDDDFYLKMTGRDLTPFSNILTMSNGTSTLTIEYKVGDFESYTGGTSTYYNRTGKWCGYFELKVSNSLTNYIGISNYINYINVDSRIPNTQVFIWLKHSDNVFEIRAEVI